MCDLELHDYEDGPTACRPTNAVLRSIRREIKQAHALSVADVRLAAHMGLVAMDIPRRTGFNDGVFYPPQDAVPENAPANRPLRAARMARAETAASAPARKLHAIALLVDFSDNAGARAAADFDCMLFTAKAIGLRCEGAQQRSHECPVWSHCHHGSPDDRRAPVSLLIGYRSSMRAYQVQPFIGQLPDVKRQRDELAPRKTAVPTITVEIPSASRYDALLPSAQATALAEVAA